MTQTVLTGSISHETNTFSSVRADLDAFRRGSLTRPLRPWLLRGFSRRLAAPWGHQAIRHSMSDRYCA
jgi:microcystin degradation protein MlrC